MKALEEIKKLLAEATPGPWKYFAEDNQILGDQYVLIAQPRAAPLLSTKQRNNNGEFIAAAPTIIARLVEEVELLRRFLWHCEFAAEDGDLPDNMLEHLQKYKTAGFEQ